MVNTFLGVGKSGQPIYGPIKPLLAKLIRDIVEIAKEGNLPVPPL